MMELTSVISDCDSCSVLLASSEFIEVTEFGLFSIDRRILLEVVPWFVELTEAGRFRGSRDRILIPVPLEGVLLSFDGHE